MRAPRPLLLGVAALLTGLPAMAAPRWGTVPATVATASPGWRPVAVEGSGPSVRRIAVGSGPEDGFSEAAAGGAPVAEPQPLERRQPADAQLLAAPIDPAPLLLPALGGGVPTGFVGGWGDYFIAGSAGTPGKLREGGQYDGSVNLGLGFGDPLRSLGVEVNWGIGSIQNFNANGSVGLSAGRILVNRPDLQVAVAGGVIDAYVYGNEAGKPSVNGYGALTVTVPLRRGDPVFPQRLQISVGGGGNSFSAIDANFQTTDAGFFVAAGLDLAPNLGFSVGQSSRSTNLNLSYIPFARLPVFVNMALADVFNSTPFGTTGVLSVGWGDSLQRGYFSN